MAHAKPEVREIPLHLIDVDDQQVREIPEDDAFSEFCESIAAQGLLQPIGVTRKEDGRYQLRWGLRRTLAHRRLKRSTIMASIYSGPEDSIKGLALVENLHRANMTMREEVDVVTYLNEVEEKSIEQIAAIVGKSRNWVLNRRMVPDLPKFLSEPLLAGDLPLSHVEIIARVPDPGAQHYLATTAVVQKWNASALKIIAECYMTPVPQVEPAQSGVTGVNPNPLNAPFLYTCEMCGEKETLEKFTLVRIHKNGYGCRTVTDRPDHESGTIHGLERRTNNDGER